MMLDGWVLKGYWNSFPVHVINLDNIDLYRLSLPDEKRYTVYSQSKPILNVSENLEPIESLSYSLGSSEESDIHQEGEDVIIPFYNGKLSPHILKWVAVPNTDVTVATIPGFPDFIFLEQEDTGFKLKHKNTENILIDLTPDFSVKSINLSDITDTFLAHSIRKLFVGGKDVY